MAPHNQSASSILPELENPITRAESLRKTFKKHLPNHPCPLPTKLLTLVETEKRKTLVFLANPQFYKNIREHIPEAKPGTHNILHLPKSVESQEIIPLASPFFEYLTTSAEIHKLQNPLSPPEIPEGQTIPIQNIIQSEIQKILEAHPNLKKRKGKVQTLQFDKKTNQVLFIDSSTLPNTVCSRLTTFPLLFNYGATRRISLIDSKSLQTLHHGPLNLQGKKTLSTSCTEALNLGLMGIPTWIK
jgi:hypothetical protein